MKTAGEEKKSTLEKILIILTWVLSAIVIYWIILKLTNHGPTADQITAGFGGIICTLIFHHHYKLGGLDEFKKHTEKEFEKIHKKLEKLDTIEVDVTALRAEMTALRTDITFIKSRI